MAAVSIEVPWAQGEAGPRIVRWLLWGFGERPLRIFGWMVVVILAFGAWYYYGANPSLNGNLAGSLSCSVSNFATVNCDHAGPVDGAAEAIIGIILLGMMVAGFSNRTRY